MRIHQSSTHRRTALTLAPSHDPRASCSLLFAGIGLVAIVSVVVTASAKCCDSNGPRQQRERPRRLIAIGFASYGAAFVVFFTRCSTLDFAYPWLLLASGFFVFGVPLSSSPSLAIYSCKVPNHRKGEYMGLANLVQGVGRIAGARVRQLPGWPRAARSVSRVLVCCVGPLATTALLNYDASHWALWGSLFAVCLLGPLSMPFVWSDMLLNMAG